MITEDGQIFTEEAYEGYGEFGGKDFYVLAAEMNGLKGSSDEETRNNFFAKVWARWIEKDGTRLYYGTDFRNYEEPISSQNGLTANKLVAEHGWKSCNVSNGGDTVDFVAAGFKMPKLVEKLPSKDNWLKEWIQLPYPESCEYQGYFYPEARDDDEDDEW